MQTLIITKMDKKLAAINIKKAWRDFARLVEQNKEEIVYAERFLEEAGYTVTKTPFMAWLAQKGCLRFRCGRYPSTYELHTDYGFYVVTDSNEAGTYFHMYDVNTRIDDIVAAGYVLPENPYRRPAKSEALITGIKADILETRSLVEGRTGGTLGEMLRSRGYLVSYDGYSVASFTKGCLVFHATNHDRWRLDDNYNAIFDDEQFSAPFSLDKEKGFRLEEDFEAIFGEDPKLGHYLTEKERLKDYKRFRVREYVPRELSTLKWFDTFEEAKKFAYEKAREYALGVRDDRKRYAHTNPIDVSDKYDYLAAYVWYGARRGSEHMVFVQGEME